MRGGSSGSGSRVTSGGSNAPVYVGAGSRDRNGRPISNTAVRRSPSPLINISQDWLGHAGYPFSPWGRWYPWYAGGWGYGYVSYDPWRVGGTRWVWGRNGLWWYGATPWYDPWYDPWYGWYGSYGYSPYGDRVSSSRSDEPRRTTGSLRLRVSPERAKVYLDGVLQGTVDDFNGLKDHLDVEAGPHQLEIRGDGYVTLKDEVVVEAGKTQTYRGALKKSSK